MLWLFLVFSLKGVVKLGGLYGCEFGDRRLQRPSHTYPATFGAQRGGGLAGRGWGGKHTSTFQVSLTLFSDAQETNRGFYFKESFDIAANPGQRNHEAQ